MVQVPIAAGSSAMSAASDRLTSLASPAFIAPLALLVINDFVLKSVFHNVLTGKLSDFAGLFALTLFASVLWPRQRRIAGVLIAGAFTFWKTSYADPLIELLNGMLPFSVGRTVDLTDLVALAVIPLAVWAAPRLEPRPVPKLLPLGLAVVALVAFTATSRAPFVARSTMDVTQVVAVDEAELQNFFDELADERGLRCEMCVPLAEWRVYVPAERSDVEALVVYLDGRKTLFFSVSAYRRPDARALARKIRREIDKRFPGVAVIDTTADFMVADGGATIFVIRVPRADVESARQGLLSIVESVARAHGLDTDAASSVHYARSNDDPRPERQGLVLTLDFDRSGVLAARVVRQNRGFEDLHRSVTEALATRLDAAFGSDNVVMHEVPEGPPPVF
jgi:hypothetical protein